MDVQEGSTAMEAMRQPAPTPQEALRERRGEIRFPLRIPVQLLSSKSKPILESRDVSFRGIFLRGEPCLALRSLVRLGLTHPVTGDELIVHAVVVRVVPAGSADGREPGVGLELFATDRTARAVWGGLVRCAYDRAGVVDDVPSGVRFAGRPRDVR